MIYCTKCGTRNEETAEHCVKCGANLKLSVEKSLEKRIGGGGGRIRKACRGMGRRLWETCRKRMLWASLWRRNLWTVHRGNNHPLGIVKHLWLEPGNRGFCDNRYRATYSCWCDLRTNSQKKLTLSSFSTAEQVN